MVRPLPSEQLQGPWSHLSKTLQYPSMPKDLWQALISPQCGLAWRGRGALAACENVAKIGVWVSHHENTHVRGKCFSGELDACRFEILACRKWDVQPWRAGCPTWPKEFMPSRLTWLQQNQVVSKTNQNIPGRKPRVTWNTSDDRIRTLTIIQLQRAHRGLVYSFV